MRARAQYEVERCKKLGIRLGAKCVRGAYMSEERAWAKEKGVEDPIHEDYKATCDSYNDVVETYMKASREGDAIIVASHNLESVQKVQTTLKEGKVKGKVMFAQLYGFGDYLTYSLRE